MKKTHLLASVLLAFALMAPLASQAANDSGAASVTSAAAVSIAPASLLAVSVHAGGTMVVESARVVGNVLEVTLVGAANSSRATFTAARNVSIAAGQVVNVVAEGSGYLLTSGGKVLCYLPGDSEQTIRSSRSN